MYAQNLEAAHSGTLQSSASKPVDILSNTSGAQRQRNTSASMGTTKPSVGACRRCSGSSREQQIEAHEPALDTPVHAFVVGVVHI